jgi:hypothetical protein
LDCADAVAADGGEQVEGAARSGVKAILQTPADRFAVGQQIVEVCLHGRALVCMSVERQGQRQR